MKESNKLHDPHLVSLLKGVCLCKMSINLKSSNMLIAIMFPAYLPSCMVGHLVSLRSLRDLEHPTTFP
jgi:hypothetical protein